MVLRLVPTVRIIGVSSATLFIIVVSSAAAIFILGVPGAILLIIIYAQPELRIFR